MLIPTLPWSMITFVQFRSPDPEMLMPSAGALMNKRSEEHTSELQSQSNLVCRLLLEKKKSCVHPARRRGHEIETAQVTQKRIQLAGASEVLVAVSPRATGAPLCLSREPGRLHASHVL